MAEFKISVPIEVGGVSGSSSSSGGGNDAVVKEIKNLNKTMFMNIDVVEMLSNLLGDVFKMLQPLVKILSLLFFMIFKPMLPAIVGLTQFIAKLIPAVDKFWKLVDEGLTEAVQDIANHVKNFIDQIKNMIEKIKEGAIWIWEGIVSIGLMFRDAAVWVWDKIVAGWNFFVGIGKWIWDSILEPAFSWLRDVGQKIWDIISAPFVFLKNMLKNVINGIIKLVNKVPGVNIPKLAAGGIVTSPTIAMIGEAGPEAVIPLNKMGQMGGITINVTGNKFNSEGDIKKMVDMISRRLAQQVGRSSS